MSLTPQVETDGKRDAIRKDLIDAIRVNVLPLSEQEWKEALEKYGFVVEYVSKFQMHLLHSKRLIKNEDILGVAKIVKNGATNLEACKRVLKIY